MLLLSPWGVTMRHEPPGSAALTGGGTIAWWSSLPHSFTETFMSWSVTLDDIGRMTEGLPDSILASVSRDNPEYETDAGLAFECAKQAGLKSATLAGGRTPSPYGGPDTVVISIVGFTNGDSFNEMMVKTITSEADTSGRSSDVPVPDSGSGEGRGMGH